LDRSPYRLFHKYHVDVLKCLADNVFSLQWKWSVIENVDSLHPPTVTTPGCIFTVLTRRKNAGASFLRDSLVSLFKGCTILCLQSWAHAHVNDNKLQNPAAQKKFSLKNPDFRTSPIW
jgi:hypothetical protein